MCLTDQIECLKQTVHKHCIYTCPKQLIQTAQI